MVCQLTTSDLCSQPQTTPLSPAKRMAPPQRRQLALDTLAGIQPVSHLAREHHLSRNFVYRQAAKAEEALDTAFSPAGPGEAEVLFYLPVTRAWLRQVVLGLTLRSRARTNWPRDIGVHRVFRPFFAMFG